MLSVTSPGPGDAFVLGGSESRPRTNKKMEMSLLLALDGAGTGGRFGLYSPAPGNPESYPVSWVMDELRQTKGMSTQGLLWGLSLIWDLGSGWLSVAVLRYGY